VLRFTPGRCSRPGDGGLHHQGVAFPAASEVVLVHVQEAAGNLHFSATAFGHRAQCGGAVDQWVLRRQVHHQALHSRRLQRQRHIADCRSCRNTCKNGQGLPPRVKCAAPAGRVALILLALPPRSRLPVVVRQLVARAHGQMRRFVGAKAAAAAAAPARAASTDGAASPLASLRSRRTPSPRRALSGFIGGLIDLLEECFLRRWWAHHLASRHEGNTRSKVR
jgi:hypothetical protein